MGHHSPPVNVTRVRGLGAIFFLTYFPRSHGFKLPHGLMVLVIFWSSNTEHKLVTYTALDLDLIGHIVPMSQSVEKSLLHSIPDQLKYLGLIKS